MLVCTCGKSSGIKKEQSKLAKINMELIHFKRCIFFLTEKLVRMKIK